MKWRIEVPEAYVIPWTHGLAYWRWDVRSAVCYPIPFNWVVAAARWLYFKLKATRGGLNTDIDRAYQAGLEEGQSRGKRWLEYEIERTSQAAFNEGYMKGQDDFKAEILRRFEEVQSIQREMREIRETLASKEAYDKKTDIG